MSTKARSHKIHKLKSRVLSLGKSRKEVSFVIGFVVIGIALLLTTRAASPMVNIEAENAPTLTSPAAKKSDTTASAGNFLQFGTGVVVPPPAPSPPAPGGRPGPGNTGPTSTNLQIVSAADVVNMIKDGDRLIDNVYINGHVIIPTGVSGTVTFRNFVVDGGVGSCTVQDRNGNKIVVPGMSCYGIQNCYNTSGCMTLVAEDGEIKNVRSTGILAANYTARRMEVHEGGGDAFKTLGSNVLIERSWGHHLGKELDPAKFANPHADFVQAQSAGSNIHIRYNYCNFEISQNAAPYHANACYIGDSSRAAVTIDIYENWLAGGNYTINCYGISTVKVYNNSFSRDYRYGPKSSCPGQWTGNKYEDGSPV